VSNDIAKKPPSAPNGLVERFFAPLVKPPNRLAGSGVDGEEWCVSSAPLG
jgi:hypothetical protein